MNTNIKLSVRSIRKNKVHSLISIVGLGIGLGSIMLLSVLFIHEKSFDKFIPDYKNTYRITRDNSSLTAYPLGEQLKQESPLVDDYFRYYEKADVEIEKSPTQKITDNNFAFADASIFNFMGIKMQTGVAAQSKTEIAVSEDIANKYFPEQNAVGHVLNIRINEEFLPLTVCGVYHNFPSNSTLSPKFIANIELSGEALAFSKKMFGDYNYDYDQFKNWDRTSFYTYLRLVPNTNNSGMTDFMSKYQTMTSSQEQQKKAYTLQPVRDIYLNSSNLTDALYSRQGNAKDLMYYLGIASLILLIAIINYISLNKAKTESKYKELGAQKALGASRTLLNRQIITESNIVAFISLIPAALVIAFGIPFANKILGQTIGIEVFKMWQTWGILIAILLLTGTLSGMLIARGSLRVSPVLLLKGKNTNTVKTSRWNNAVLSVHFSIFIILLASAFTINKQLKFAVTNFKGINPDNVLVYELNSSELSQQFNVIKNEVDKLPGIVTTAGSSFIPPFNNFLPISIPDENGDKVKFDGLIMGQGMLNLLGIEVLEGEAFGDYQQGKPQFIFNESAAKKYDIKVGTTFNNIYVRAIVKDFNAHSLRKLIQPMTIIQQNPTKMRLFAIKTDGKNNAALIKSINGVFHNISPDKTVSSYWLTDEINHFYTQEQNQATLISVFSVLAIFLSVIGLLGMTLVSINRKTKEIGIRKVNGATISEVLILLNSSFVKWVAIAFVIATPIAYYVMNKWLENFAYKTELSWWIFALTGLLALGIALLTVSWQSWKAATRNPVEALRYE